MDHFIEGVGIWGRPKMIEIGVPEDVVDMYIEMISHELRDPQHKLSLKLYRPALMKLTIGGV